MSLAVYNIKELQKNKGLPCLWCLVISSAVKNLVTHEESRNESLHIYETEKQRDNGLKHWRHEYKFHETVFFIFEVPIDFYLEKAEKLI